MSRIIPFKLIPAVLTGALVMLGSTSIASAQYYDQGASPDQSAPADQNAQADPPDRVARLAYLNGDVEFAPAGEDDWGDADINRPLITGDRLMTGKDGRAALELGDAALRINDNSAFNFLDLNDTTTQAELSQGTLNLRVRAIGDGQTYEIDTPTAAFIAEQPGTYRVDVAPDGNGAMVTVFEGSGTVYGENGVSRPVRAGQSYRFSDSSLANVQVQRVPAPDDFDRFCQSRDQRFANSVSRKYVSADVVGYDDLDQYGDWQDTSDYGQVWYPNHVAADWAPYRDGHWAWIEPWGWTWVDSEPWGYAPFHYGRWAYVRDRWGWVPGQRTVRPVYAPALVAFVGGSGFSVSVSVGGGNPVGWFPLGPRDVYVPPYRASRNYFTSINVSNIRNVYVNKTVINNYYNGYTSGHRYAGGREYAYRNNPRAFTAVPRNVFAGARPVRSAVLHVKPGALARATVASMPHVAPTRASLAIRPPKRAIARPVAKAFNRTVVARHAPPPRPVPFAAREKVIAKQGGAPIPVAQLHQMRQQRAKAQSQPQRVKVVAAGPKRGAMERPPVEAPRRGANPPHRASIHPIQAPVHPARGTASNPPPREAPLRQGELPSARFAHHPQNGTNPPQQHAAENQQRAQQARQKADQAQRNGEHAQAQTEQRRAQAAQAHANAEQTRQEANQNRAQQHVEQARQRDQQTQQAKQRAQQEQQHADQERARGQQQAEQARKRDQQAQQAKQRAQQEQQHADQERARGQQQAEQARKRDQQAQQAQQRADQKRAQRQQQQQADQEHQRADQERAQRQQQQRAGQQRVQQEQRREQQRQAQMQQQHQAQEARVRAQQQEQHARQQQPQHAPPPHSKEQKKKKDHDQQDDGGH